MVTAREKHFEETNKLGGRDLLNHNINVAMLPECKKYPPDSKHGGVYFGDLFSSVGET